MKCPGNDSSVFICHSMLDSRVVAEQDTRVAMSLSNCWSWNIVKLQRDTQSWELLNTHYTSAYTQSHTQSVPHRTMCNISFCDVDSKVDQFFQPTLYIIVIVLGLPTNCMALWAAYMQVRRTQTQCHQHSNIVVSNPVGSGFDNWFHFDDDEFDDGQNIQMYKVYNLMNL